MSLPYILEVIGEVQKATANFISYLLRKLLWINIAMILYSRSPHCNSTRANFQSI